MPRLAEQSIDDPDLSQEGERKLLCYLLALTIGDYQGDVRAPGSKGLQKKDHADAVAWLMDDKSDDLYSFRGMCEALGFDVDLIRAQVVGGAKIKFAKFLSDGNTGAAQKERERNWYVDNIEANREKARARYRAKIGHPVDSSKGRRKKTT